MGGGTRDGGVHRSQTLQRTVLLLAVLMMSSLHHAQHSQEITYRRLHIQEGRVGVVLHEDLHLTLFPPFPLPLPLSFSLPLSLLRPSPSVLPLLFVTLGGWSGYEPSSLALWDLQDLSLGHGWDGVLSSVVIVRELLEDVLPALLLLEFVHSGGDEGDKAATPHARATGDNGGGEGGAGVVDELAGWVEALAAMTEEAGGVGLGVQVEKEGPKHHGQTAVEDIEAVLELNCGRGERERGREIGQGQLVTREGNEYDRCVGRESGRMCVPVQTEQVLPHTLHWTTLTPTHFLSRKTHSTHTTHTLTHSLSMPLTIIHTSLYSASVWTLPL